VLNNVKAKKVFKTNYIQTSPLKRKKQVRKPSIQFSESTVAIVIGSAGETNRYSFTISIQYLFS